MIAELSRHPRDRVALVDAGRGRSITFGDLLDQIEASAGVLRAAGGRALAFLGMAPDAGAVTAYFGALQADVPLCLVETQPGPLARLTEAYHPELLILPDAAEGPAGYRAHAPAADGYRLWIRRAATQRPLHPDLALMLTTSGSTGSPKLVRLSRDNLRANALSIGEYLGLTGEERAVQSLPQHYSYGLSVLNSHLLAGGSVVLTAHSFMRPEFWGVVDRYGCTSFAGVPYMYETLHRLRFAPSRHPSLRSLTQAGGALRKDLIAHFHALAESSGFRFYVMYGQTEATARISYVPPASLGRKIGSIGIAIPGGTLRLSPLDDDAERMELVYEGPNVMMGYADSPEDLALGDVQRGVLRTGDLGTVDEDGFFSVTGRLKRFAKLFGRRVSLEDVEHELESRFPVRVAATDGGDRLVLYAVLEPHASAAAIGEHAAKFLGVPPPAVEVRVAQALPLTTTGKKDYRALESPR